MKRRKIFLSASILLATLGAKAEGFNEASCIRFCNEPLPVYDRRAIQNYEIALFNTGSSSLRYLKPRINDFFSTVEPILKKYGIPADFKYLGIVESNVSATALSEKGAYGYWQFMPETARQLGLIVNEEIDERENLVKSTHAACRYFISLYKEFGSWSLVAAAYNAGPNKVKNHLLSQRKSTYYDLRLGSENEQYVYRIIAIKELLTRPNIYKNIMLRKITLSKFFSKYGISLGLATPPKIRAKKKFSLLSYDVAYEGTSNESLAYGFDKIVPLSYKRGKLKSFLPSPIKSNSSLAQNNDTRRRLILWRNTLRIPYNRRQDLKSLLAAAKILSSPKILFRIINV